MKRNTLTAIIAGTLFATSGMAAPQNQTTEITVQEKNPCKEKSFWQTNFTNGQFNGFYSDEIYEVEDSPIMSLYDKEINKATLVA